MSDEPMTDPELQRVEAALRLVEPDDLRPVRPPDAVWDHIASAIESDTGARTVVDLAERRRRRAPALLLAVAAATILVVAGALVVTLARDDATILARADLTHDRARFDPLGASAAAVAELVDGSTLRLTDADLPGDLGEPADLEVWLIEPDAAGNVVDLVSLGIVGERDEFAVPPGYDPAVFRVVDISIEPRDGAPEHSGRSILRGALVEA